MDKKDRVRKLWMIYDRVQKWITINSGKADPASLNIARAALREIEELTVWVDNQDQTFKSNHMKRLNELWKQYKS